MSRTPTLAEVIRTAIEDRLAEVHVCLPGKIESYDAGKQKADVKPLIRRLQKTIDGEIKEDLPVIPAVPVAFPRVGKFRITMPLEAGDHCLLVFCERSIDNYQLSGSLSDPENFFMHDLSDAVAIPGWYPDTDPLAQTDSSNMVLGEEGNPEIHIGGDQINLYEKTAADFIALAQKVLTNFSNLQTWIDAHTHAYLDTPIGTALTSPPTKNPAGVPPDPSPTPSSVAAQKVKAT